MGEKTCGLAPKSGAPKEYREGYGDALRAIRRGKVVDPEGKLAERTEKFLDGDAYSGGVAQALTDTGVASPLVTSGYKLGNDAYRCLVAGSTAKPAPAPQGKTCNTTYRQAEGLAPVYDKVEICTETVGNAQRTTTRTQTYKMSMRNDFSDPLIEEKIETRDRPLPNS